MREWNIVAMAMTSLQAIDPEADSTSFIPTFVERS